MGASSVVAQLDASWATICIERLLIDVPKDVEIVSAPLELRSPYVIAGLGDRAARGPSWSGLDISETQATDAAGLQQLKEGAVRELAEHQLANDQTVETAKQQIEGVLGGAVKAGTGLQLIAAKDAIDVQSQSNVLSMQARDDVSVMSANAHIDWAAAKKISLSTAGGANITIDGGNITVQCPGKLVILAGKKSFAGPEATSYPLPKLPAAAVKPEAVNFDLLLTSTPGPLGTPLSNYDWQIIRSGASARDRVIVKGVSDDDGKLAMTEAQQLRLSVAIARWPNDLRLIAPGIDRPLDIYPEQDDWHSGQKTLHALAALDFSNVPGTHIATEESKKERERAGEATNEASTFKFFDKLH